jgi:hypothetical protein
MRVAWSCELCSAYFDSGHSATCVNALLLCCVVPCRLAMEPGVADQLQQHWDAAAALAAGPRHTPVSTGAADYCNAGSSSDSTPQPEGLSSLLGQQLSLDQFLTAHWEVKPALFRSQPGNGSCSLAHLPQQQQLTAGISALPQSDEAPATACAVAAVERLASQLTPPRVLLELLPGALHCPVLPTPIGDPLQVVSLTRCRTLCASTRFQV